MVYAACSPYALVSFPPVDRQQGRGTQFERIGRNVERVGGHEISLKKKIMVWHVQQLFGYHFFELYFFFGGACHTKNAK